jgi:TetR/AcrR family transcriptional regulator
MAKSNSAKKPKQSRIQVANNEKILSAALETFATFGYRGSTLDQIAKSAGMSKPNLLYYYNSKEDIYGAILENILELWIIPLSKLNADGDPMEEIKDYIIRKLNYSKNNPLSSKLFAQEIMQGAKNIKSTLSGPLKQQYEETVDILQQWIDRGLLKNINPYHLIFMIWATTQHYADFYFQIELLLENKESDKIFKDAQNTILSVFIDGIKPE